MKPFLIYISTVAYFICTTSCNDQQAAQDAHPIRLGDSAMIVTEADSQYLKNVVDDIEPVAQSTTKEVAEPAVIKSTDPAPAPVTTTASTSKNDFVLNIKNNTQIVFKNIATKEFKNQNPETQHDLAYLITSGSLDKSQLGILNGTLTELQYKVSTAYFVNTSQGEIELTSLKGETSSWQKLPTKGNIASIPNPTINTSKTISGQQIQAAIEKAINNKRYKASIKNKLRKELAGVKSINHNLISVKPENQQLTISGKDSKGADFKKVIRFDI